MNPLGVIVGVDGDIAQVGMYNMSNETEYLWDGKLLAGPKVGAFLTVKQNDIKIIAIVTSEKIIDQQNTVKSAQFDNRYSPNSINRIVCLKTQGVIDNGKFQLTSEHVPMIGNEVMLTSPEDLNSIYDVEDEEPTISIGKSVREKQTVKLPINKFFASHIGIFGNTGSGKSNTLHKLYLELFKSQYRSSIFEKSKFFVIDFNGEYTQAEQFGVRDQYKKIFNINTRSNESDKLPITKSYLFNPDILAILFDARPATQIPFLRDTIKKYRKIYNSYNREIFAKFEVGLLKSILKIGNSKQTLFSEWLNICSSLGMCSNSLKTLKAAANYKDFGNPQLKINNEYFFINGEFTEEGKQLLRKIVKELQDTIDGLSEINKLKVFFEFQKVYISLYESGKSEYINPLFKRIEVILDGLDPILNLVDIDTLKKEFTCLNIINLVNANQEIKRLVPMMLSKMIYDRQKEEVSQNSKIMKTCHLIIDEAHNILSSEFRRNGDSWQDFRLSVFEEIIKEGRKFGFFLTLASQRPADISPTIISQLHNFFVHRLVNENDLRMLENTMPTLDKNSYNEISSLGQGEAIITGNAMRVPVIVKVRKEKYNRPKSDDIVLTDLWGN
ncbi:ATP-binding protein [Limosilactobacillus mucosae]|uniref:ATP-binding protein n=1 Tax=Limosilactobacillus mucosae TaxID=97478 RepID=UPI003992FE6D